MSDVTILNVWPEGDVVRKADYDALKARLEAAVEALREFYLAASSWHELHKHVSGIQCDRICAAIPQARAVLASATLQEPKP